jgi:hypothetical protein
VLTKRDLGFRAHLGGWQYGAAVGTGSSQVLLGMLKVVKKSWKFARKHGYTWLEAFRYVWAVVLLR